jgi:hypothetical protein
MRRFFKGGWTYDSAARMIKRGLAEPRLPLIAVLPALLAKHLWHRDKPGPYGHYRFKQAQRTSAGGVSRKLKLPHRKHNKIINGKLIYGGY